MDAEEKQMGELQLHSLVEQAAGRLEEMIISSKLNPGDKLPNEQALAAQVGVGRGTIREAVKILESRGVVEIRRGRGTFVCSHVGQAGDPLGFRFARDKRKLAEDLSELRLMLEPQIAALCAKTASHEDVEALQLLCTNVEQRIAAGEDYSDEDIEFHEKIAQMTGNTVIPQLIPLIAQGISLYVNLTHHTLAGSAASTHQAVVDAIRAHDPQAAYEAMARHMRENRENLESLEG